MKMGFIKGDWKYDPWSKQKMGATNVSIQKETLFVEI